MSSKATQDQRIAELTVPGGKDKMVLTRLDVVEGLSELFEIRVECLSYEENKDFNSLLGRNACVKLKTVGKKTRYFNGVIVEGSWSGEQQMMSAYKVVMRPWTWLTDHIVDSRIFQNKSVPDIIKDVFDKAGFTDYQFRTSESYKPREYCVQYRESHFAFVSRLMEEEGMYYYFTHSADKHVMVITDSISGHDPIKDLPKLTFVGAGERTRDDEEFIRDWTLERRFRSGKVTVNAFDFVKPTAKMTTDQSAPGGYMHDSLEVYTYPKGYKKGQESDLGNRYARAILQAAQAEDRRRVAAGDAPSVFPGGLTTVQKHKTGSENAQYLVVRATHSFVGEAYRTGVAPGAADSYYGNYVFQPKDRPFRAPHATDKPVIYGPQTATVVGPSGEEIYTDEHGRVKLQFHWDRLGKKDEKSSRWVRVSQVWAGKKWGGVYIPRIGMEAVVEFIEGDPDRPLVVGCVYNGDNKLPYDMPANKTQSGIKTRSSKGGSDSNYNELLFEDKKGSEFVRFNAEKDLDSTIEDTEKRLIKGKNRSGAGDKARDTTVEKGDDNLTIQSGDNNVTITGKQTIKVTDVIHIHSDTKIIFSVGPGKLTKVTLTPQGIELETPKMDTKTTLSTTIDGGGFFTQKAGLIKIN